MSEDTSTAVLQHKLQREIQARQEAERLLEAKSAELVEANQRLQRLNEHLEQRVDQRTAEWHEAHSRLAALLDNLRGGLIVEDEHRRVVQANRTFCDMFGIPLEPSDLIGQDCAAMAQQGAELFLDPTAFTKRLDELLSQREAVNAERWKTVDGRVLERDYIPIFVGSDYRGHLWYYRDVTLPARTYESLQTLVRGTAEATGSAFFQALAEYLAEALGVRLAWVAELLPGSTSKLRLLGGEGPWPDTEQDGERILTAAGGPCIDVIRTGFVHVPEGLAERYPNFAPTYAPGMSSFMGAAMVDPCGGCLGLVCLMHDQPLRHASFADSILKMFAARAAAELDRERVESELRASEAEARKLSMVAARTENAVIITDARGHIEWVNEGFTRVTGYTLDEVQGDRPGRILQGPKTDWNETACIGQRVRDGKGFQSELLNYRKDGTPFWIAIECQPIFNDAGELTHFMAVESDVTERRQAEQELQQAKERAEEANLSKSQFLANMSHELRTPMTAIMGYANLMGRPHVDPGEFRDWAVQIRRNADHLLMLLNDILDLSKVDAGRLHIQMQRVDLAEILETVASLMRPRAIERHLRFGIVRQDSQRWALVCDPTRLRQILYNLVSNAIKFTQRGSVTLWLSEAPGRCHDQPGALHIAVQDTGIGIDSERLPQLFEPFTQVHDRRTHPQGGTGLGLAVSQRLASLMGGRIEVESAPERGSTFTLILPLAGQAPAPSADPTASAGNSEPTDPSASVSADSMAGEDGAVLTGASVLVVDDNPDNQRIIRFLLEEAGASVRVAVDGRDGMAAVSEADLAGEPFDLILMDIQMPLMDGYEATTRLREWGVPTPIIALTAYAMDSDRQRCQEAGCDDFITKPIDPPELIAALRWHLQRASASPTEAPPEQVVEPDSAPVKSDELDDPAAEASQAAEPMPLRSQLADNPRFAPLLQQYLDALPGMLEQLEAAWQEGDSAAVRRLAHRLRGTGANYGYPQITEAAAACEDPLRQGVALADLHAELAQIRHLLHAATLAPV